MRLIALRPVLYLAHQYSVGDQLPVNNPGMTEAWIEAGSAEWREDVESNSLPKAIPTTAIAGQMGMTDSGTEDSIAGRVPVTPERKKPAARKKTTARKKKA